MTGTSKWWAIGVVLLLFLVSVARLVPMLFSFYLVWQDPERRCGFAVLAVDVAQDCQSRGTTLGSEKHRPVIVVSDEGMSGGGSEVQSHVDLSPEIKKLRGGYPVPLFPGGWGAEKPSSTTTETADFGDSLTVGKFSGLQFSGPLTLIVHSLRPRTDAVRLVALRRAVEYLRHIDEGAVVLIVKTQECLGCIPDKMIREVGRLELWDFFPRSPAALYSTNTLIYGRQRTSDVTYGF